VSSPSLGDAGGQSAQPAAGADALKHVNEALSTIQRLASTVKKSEASQVQDRLSSHNSSSQIVPLADSTGSHDALRSGAVASEDEDILDLTSDLISAEPAIGLPVGSRGSALTLVRETQDDLVARGSSAEPKGVLTKLLASGDRADSSDGLPRSASEEVASALNRAKAALHGVRSGSDFSTHHKKFRGRSTGTAVLGKAAETTSNTAPSSASAKRVGSGAAVTSDRGVSLAERREINRRLDAVTNELATLSTRIGALERLVERCVAQPPRRRLLRSRQESED
jgi:hypothetical protein